MIIISLRDFQIKPSVYINNLPITLTRFGKPIAVVSNIEDINSPAIAQAPIVTTPVEKKVENFVPEDALPSKPIVGWCQQHYEPKVNYDLTLINYEDENANLIVDKKYVCPKCLAKYENMGRGRVYYL